MTDRIGDDFKFYQEAINLRQHRQEVLAANIANADTPNYKARDFDFSQALRAVAQGSQASRTATELKLTSMRHLPGKAQMPDAATLLYRQPLQPSLDGNTVEMDTERVQFADNTQRYQADLTIISARIKTIMAALQQ
ncbi:flagellar basal body rod protein FlgB [Allopusillimonas ginsengisoli]|uniref:flagellar basal body rod protein FlgB n=1 Tax=Allopusillimonas ginsengisoli TaxID=453575 RepID=UPI0010C238A2|nr:flagellar basal body rod protein FlgB [Allopusillimonas ginsengisoli]